MLKKIIPGILERGAKLTQLGLNFSLKELELSVPRSKEEFLKLKEKQVKELIRILGDLKGASLKIGQALTLDLIDSWPSEIKPLIQNLSFKSAPRPSEEMLKILQGELKSNFSHVKYFSSESIASASIGQVHRAEINGRSVAIKIQYPGISSSLDHDLKVFKFLVFAITKLYQKDKINFDIFFEELEETLKKECDYLNELKQQNRFRDLVAKDEVFSVPTTMDEFCTSKVLVSEFCDGMTFDQWIETNPSYEEKQFISHELLRLLIQEIFVWGIVQSDAHGGNFLIDSKLKKIILLDFGATKELSSHFISQYTHCLRLTFKSDWKNLEKHVREIGWIDQKESPEVFNSFKIMMEHLVSAFKGDFDFKDESYVKISQRNAWNFARACQFSPPPRELTFVHRKLGGVFFLLRRLEAKIDLYPFVKDLGLVEDRS